MKTEYNIAAVVAMISVSTIGELIRKKKQRGQNKIFFTTIAAQFLFIFFPDFYVILIKIYETSRKNLLFLSTIRKMIAETWVLCVNPKKFQHQNVLAE